MKKKKHFMNKGVKEYAREKDLNEKSKSTEKE